MNRNFGIGILILCFGFSNVNLGWADGTMEVSPVVAQPYEIQELNQQMIDRDRQNRDEEITIKQLVEDNDKLTQAALAHQQDEGLAKINQTMLSYRDALLARDRARIIANGEKGWTSRYGDLIALTEDADAMTVHRDLEDRSGLLAEKYQMLTELKDEMTALNDKLKSKGALNQNETIDGFKKIAQQQEDKIQMLTQRLGEMDKKIANFDEIIAEKDHQIAQLKETIKEQEVPGSNAKDEIIKEKQAQVDLLKSELEDKITELENQGRKGEGFKGQSAVYANVRDQIMALKDRMNAQARDLKAKDESIRWANQVLAAAKNKAEYYQLTSQQDQLSMKQVQDQVQNIKDDFARRFKDYDQFENAIVSLKSQVSQLSLQLSQKQQQVDALKAQLKSKNTEKDQVSQEILNIAKQENKQGQQVTRIQQELKDKLQDKEDQIVKLKADILAILQSQANKEIYHRNAAAQVDDRIQLAKQLIGLQQEEAALLEEKSGLYVTQSANFDKHFSELESKIKGFLASHQVQTADIQNRMEELKDELSQKGQQVDLLNAELKNKITEEKNRSLLAGQVQDLKTQLQGQEAQIASMKNFIQEGLKSKEQADSFKQQLAQEEDEADQLKQQLDSKTAESNQMALMLGDYQKKLESRDNAYNQELGQELRYKNDQASMEKQIAFLNDQLQQKEAQVIKIKKDMYDLQVSNSAQDRDIQTKDLSLSMIQQKTLDDKINEFQDEINGLHVTNVRQLQEITSLRAELAMARQQLDGVPSSDELEFLRTGLQKATIQLKKKDQSLTQIKADFDEYSKEFKSQTREFQSVKDQLLEVQQELKLRDEDLKYKDMEVIRLKGIKKGLMGQTHENKVEALQARLKKADAQIRELQAQLSRLGASSKTDPLEEKLTQALDKIDEQGRVINILAKKLQDSGQNVDLTR